MRAVVRLAAIVAATVAGYAEPVAGQINQARAVQGVNVRTGPGAQFPVVGTLQGGEVVGLAGCDRYWCQIAGGRGWVSRQYLSIGGEPASVAGITRNGQAVAVEPLPPPAMFTGAWMVIPSPVVPETALTYAFLAGQPPEVEEAAPPPPFRLLIAQAGDIVEGVGQGIRLEGVVDPNGREATITMTTADGERLDGKIVVEGSALTAVIQSDGTPVATWRATRTILTQ